MTYKEVEGNLITMALAGKFAVIAHGCNCFCRMTSGLAVPMAEIFGCRNPELFPLESIGYEGDIAKLGHIEYLEIPILENKVSWEEEYSSLLTVVNAYTQYKYGKYHPDGVENPLDYEALTLCLRKMNHIFKGQHIGLPQIGCGLAGGEWFKVREIIIKELKDCDVTVVIHKK